MHLLNTPIAFVVSLTWFCLVACEEPLNPEPKADDKPDRLCLEDELKAEGIKAEKPREITRTVRRMDEEKPTTQPFIVQTFTSEKAKGFVRMWVFDDKKKAGEAELFFITDPPLTYMVDIPDGKKPEQERIAEQECYAIGEAGVYIMFRQKRLWLMVGCETDDKKEARRIDHLIAKTIIAKYEKMYEDE